MARQRGQALIEFALMAPMIFLFIFGMIYGAAIFMDYLNFSNDARTVARNIAVTTNETTRESLKAGYNANQKFTRFYTMTRTVSFVDADGNEVTSSVDAQDVMVTVTFKRDNKDLPNVLKWVGFPPETVNPIKYTMKLEKLDSSS